MKGERAEVPPGRSGVSRRAGTLATAAALALAATVLLAACACGSDDDEATEDPTTTPTTEAPPTTLSVEDEVEAAYLAFWEMNVRLGESPNPADPEIAQRASGEALGNLVDGLTTLQSANQRTEFGDRYRHEVTTINLTGGSTAVLEDCAVDDSRLVDASTGRTVAQAVVTELLRAALVHRGGHWFVDQMSTLNSWTGAVDCA